MTTRPYIYPIVSVVRIVDGDSFWLQLDVGFRQIQLTNIRLAGWDCPEMRGGSEYERLKAKEATALSGHFLTQTDGKQLWIMTQKDPDSFGRWLGDIWREDFETVDHLGDLLESAQLAVRWPLRWHDIYDPSKEV